ncbi:MAG: vitamin K epoxide reductase family protein [Bifidobacteriaceae bacterium]|jgi:uncharacterized membrane protein|nr:vitamin K epoxide reductase family protein [Bifidobacteriaceae bacterium]
MVDRAAQFLAFRSRNGWIFTTMLISSCLSLMASFVLSLEAVRLAADPSAELVCDINQVISCGTVALSWQASVFGFPNAFLGLIAEPVVITMALAALTGVRFRRGFMLAAQCVYTIGLGFAYWLFYQSVAHIGAVCPWCLLVTISTTLVFSTLTHVNIRDGNLPLPAALKARLKRGIAAGVDLAIVVGWLSLLAVVIVVRYGQALIQ